MRVKVRTSWLIVPLVLLASCSAAGPESDADQEEAIANRAQAIHSAADKQVDRAVDAIEPVEVWSPAGTTPTQPAATPQ